jgi:MFS family permease
VEAIFALGSIAGMSQLQNIFRGIFQLTEKFCRALLGAFRRQIWPQTDRIDWNDRIKRFMHCVRFFFSLILRLRSRWNDPANKINRMGFSTGIFMCALIRAFAGLMSSCIRVAVAAMLGDISHSSRAKARSFSRLPLVATGGVIGPLLQAALAHRFANDGIFWKTYPILISQMACAALMLAIFGVNLVMLKEVWNYLRPLNEEMKSMKKGFTKAAQSGKKPHRYAECKNFESSCILDIFNILFLSCFLPSLPYASSTINFSAPR